MLEELKVLQDVRIASPCDASWEAMKGGEQVRFCGQCQLHVHNLSAMDPSRAAALVQATERRLCVRYDARPDGSMLTEPQGPGCRPTRRRFLTQLAASLFGLLGLRSFATAAGKPTTAPPQTLQGGAVPPPQRTMGKIAMPAVRTQPRMGEPTMTDRPPAGTTTGPVPPRALMGDMALPPRSGVKPTSVANPKPKQSQRIKPHKPRHRKK